MGSELKSVGDLAASGIISLSTGPFGSALHKHDYRESGRPVVPAEAISDGDLDSSKLNYIDEEKADELTRYFLEPGDLVFARRGAQACGHSAYVGEEHHGAIAGTGLLYARVLKKDVLDPLYFFLATSSAESVRWLKTHAIGATMPNLNTGIISSTPFRLITIDQQREIIGNYLPLRKKLSLLAQMNATLEGMAQALFKSWFVDFDPVIDNALAAGNPIPDELAPRAEVRRLALASSGEPSRTNGTTQQGSVEDATLSDLKVHFPAAFQFTEELGWIPEGWEVEQVKDFGSVVCGKTPSKSNADYYGDDVPFIKIPDMYRSAWITETTDGLSFAGANSQAKKQIPAKSISVSCIATVGKVVITSEPSHTNQQINSVIPNAEYSRNYLYFSFLEKNKELHDLASGGSATLNLNTGVFSKIRLLSPPATALELYHEATNPLFEKMLANDRESQSLTKLRDTLLPRLISGELQTRDAEVTKEEAMA